MRSAFARLAAALLPGLAALLVALAPQAPVAGVPAQQPQNTCTAQFSDVPAGAYFYDPVLWLACGGAISGYTDGTFRPGNDVTRAQLSKIITLAAGWTLRNPTQGHFSDVPPGSAFYPVVETAYAHGIISGYADSTFRPGNPATRAQIAK